MGFRSNTYAKVWEIKDNGNYADVRIGISRKNRQTEQYEQDFGGYVRFIGSAYEGVKKVGQGGTVRLGEVDVTNSYDKEKKVTYTNFKVFSLAADGGAAPAPSPAVAKVSTNDDGLPFDV